METGEEERILPTGTAGRHQGHGGDVGDGGRRKGPVVSGDRGGMPADRMDREVVG